MRRELQNHNTMFLARLPREPFLICILSFRKAVLLVSAALYVVTPISFCRADTFLPVEPEVLQQAYECRQNTGGSHQKRLISCEALVSSPLISNDIKIEFRMYQIFSLLLIGDFSRAISLSEQFLMDMQTLLLRGESLPFLSKEGLSALNQDFKQLQRQFSDQRLESVMRKINLIKTFVKQYETGEIDKAVRLLLNEMMLDQDSFFALMMMLFAEKDEADTRRTIDKIIARYPDTPEAYILRALLRADRGSYEAALEDLSKALERHPKNKIALKLRAIIAIENGDLETAHEDLQKAFSVDPTDDEVIIMLADIASRRGHFNQAMHIYDLILSALPNVTEARLARGKLNYRTSRWSDAERDFETLFGNDEVEQFLLYRLRAETRWRRGLISLARQDDRRALQLSEQALKIEPKDTQALFVKAASMLRLDTLRNVEQASIVLQEVVDNNPGDPDAWLWLGHAERLHGRVEAAIKAYDMALRLAPGWGDIWHGRGLALAAMGQKGEAEKAFARAIELGFLPAREALATLQGGQKGPQY